MKTSIKVLTIFSLFFFISITSFGQECSGITMNRNIELNGSSSSQEIKLEVAKHTNHINIGVNSSLESGSLTVEIYDPKGNKQGNYSVESQISANSQMKESVCGQMQKSIKDPIKGDWIVKIIPNKAKGKVSICTRVSEAK